MRLEGKTAIVTGGGRGIGEAIAMALAAEGCAVAVAGRSEAHLEKVAGKIRESGREAMAVRCDVTDPQAVKELFGKAKQKWEKLAILVNLYDIILVDGVVKEGERDVFKKFQHAFEIDEKTARKIREFLMLRHDMSLFTDPSHPYNDDDFSINSLFRDV